MALGGGGSRAFAHLGVLARLDEEGIRPAFVSGSSMGAVVGAIYAADPHIGELLPRLREYFARSPLFGGLAHPARSDGLHHRHGRLGRLARKFAVLSITAAGSFRMGLRKFHPVNRVIDAFFPDLATDLSGLALPFGLNALDITTGEVRDFVRGPLNPLLKSGVAVGLVFSPYRHGGAEYVDPAPVAAVPVGLCRKLGAPAVLAVNVSSPLDKDFSPESGFDVVRRILAIQSDILNRREVDSADVVVSPMVSDIFWADFSRVDLAVERGREAADAVIEDIRALCG